MTNLAPVSSTNCSRDSVCLDLAGHQMSLFRSIALALPPGYLLEAHGE